MRPDREVSSRGDLTWLPTKTQFFILLSLYFIFQAFSRGLISETLGLDDAEQVLLAQSWSWGYGPQPPLYTWLVIFFTYVFGISSFTLVLLKQALLLGIYLLTYYNARFLTRSHAASVAAVAALEFMPSIAWEAHRELTHSILASTLVLAALLVFFQLKPERWRGYLLFGVLAGLGSISKYNFSLVFAGLLLAGLSIAPLRSTVLNRRMAFAILIAFVVALPNLLWITQHKDLAFASVHKFGIDPVHHWGSIFKGLGKLAVEYVNQAGIVCFVLMMIFRKSAARQEGLSPNQQCLCLMFFWISVIMIMGTAIFSVTELRNRWFQPLFIATPLLLISIWHKQLDASRQKIIFLMACVVGMGVAVAAPVRLLLTEPLHKTEILNAPFRKLAQDLQDPLAGTSSILSDDRWLAGNLRVWFPEKKITITEMVKLYPPDSNSALVWDASGGRADRLPQLAVRYTGQFYGPPVFCDAKLKYHNNGTMRVGLSKPAGAGEKAN